MEAGIAYIRKAIQDLAGKYEISPQVAQELLQKILKILRLYKEDCKKPKGVDENEYN